MNESETLWLNLTNIALGAVTLICFIAFGAVILKEAAAYVRERARARARGSAHELVLRDLGVTMADGGEAIDERRPGRSPSPDDESGDPPGIFRSEN